MTATFLEAGDPGAGAEANDESRFYDDEPESDSDGSSGSSSDDAAASPRTRQRNLRARHGAEDPANAFAASIKGLASGFGVRPTSAGSTRTRTEDD